VKAKDPPRAAVVSFSVLPADDCSLRAYPAGTAFVDPRHGHGHRALNPTDEETVLVATVFEAQLGRRIEEITTPTTVRSS
jgi:hypothetical protein